MKASWIIFIDKKNDRVLLTKRSKKVRNPGQWCFPGGSSRKHKAKKLAIKEAREEVGLELDDIELILKVLSKTKKYYYYFVYVKAKKTPIILNKESSRFKWKKINELNNQNNLHKSVKIFLKNYQTNGKKKKLKKRTNIRIRKITK